jgi:hypothetical protein
VSARLNSGAHQFPAEFAVLTSKQPESTRPTLASSTITYLDPIPGLIPFGTVNIMSGASGAGKTTLKSSWCYAWKHGQPILGFPTNRPTGLYYLAADRPWHPTYADTFHAAHLHVPEDIEVYALLDDPTYDCRSLKLHTRDQDKKLSAKKNAYDFLWHCLERLHPIPGSLVFIDPLAPLFIEGDQNCARDVALSLHWLRRCAQRLTCTFICDANVAKLREGEDFKRPQDRISGSGAFLAYADTVFNFTEDGALPTDPRTLSWRPRRAPAGEAKFCFDTTTKLYVPYTESSYGGGYSSQDRPTALLTLVPAEGIEIADLFDAYTATFGLSLAQLKRDITTLFKDGRLIRDAHGHYRKRKLN